MEKYPKPPFEPQLQPWPGLASEMKPKPDHGETSYQGSGRLAGKKALITGGDSGIGRAAAIAYAREGADVALNYFPTEEPDAQEVIELIQAAGRRAVAIPGDLREEAFCGQLIEQAVRELGGLDILVNNAARQQTKASILEISTEEFDATMKTNIYAPFWLIKAALPHLQPGAVIIGTASVQAYEPSAELYDYAQTKAATVSYVKSLASRHPPRILPSSYPVGGTISGLRVKFCITNRPDCVSWSEANDQNKVNPVQACEAMQMGFSDQGWHFAPGLAACIRKMPQCRVTR